MIAKKKHKLDDNKRTDYETMTLSLHYMVNWKEKKKYTGVQFFLYFVTFFVFVPTLKMYTNQL